MSKSRTSLAAVIALTVSAGGVAVAVPSASAAPASPSAAAVDATVAAPDDRARELYDKIVAKLPADWQQRQAEMRERAGIEPSPLEQMVSTKIRKAGWASSSSRSSVINPDDYQCSTTRLDAYVDSILEGADPSALFALDLLGGLQMPTYDALLYGTPGQADYALPAEHRGSLRTTFEYSKRFWDVSLNDIKLHSMDRDIYSDRNQLARVVGALYGVGPADAVDIADLLIEIVEGDPVLDGGKNPIFTLNAFAASDEGETDPLLQGTGDKVIFGDGILSAMTATGNGTIGPKAIMSHEMAHHVQYENGTFEEGTRTPEGTRRTELMADAFGTYFGAHKKGLNLGPARVLKFHQAFYDVGDCQFAAPNHHGTPNQRNAASAWGAASVAYATNPNRVIPSARLTTQFDRVLPQIVAPDAPGTIGAYREQIAS